MLLLLIISYGNVATGIGSGAGAVVGDDDNYCVSSGFVDIFIPSMTIVRVSAEKIKLTFDNFHKKYHGYLNIELGFSTK